MTSRCILENYSWFLIVHPTKVKAHKSFQLTKGSLDVENKEHLGYFVSTLYFTSLCSNDLRSSKVSKSILNMGLCLSIFTQMYYRCLLKILSKKPRQLWMFQIKLKTFFFLSILVTLYISQLFVFA